ncbi:MAG: hypothetical protein ABJC04_01610 [Verrucomicrobiota bacterium]
MRRFAYCQDPIFLLGSAAYSVNRWWIKPHFHNRFFRGHFNDLWLIPCALPLLLWIHRRLGWRTHDEPPHFFEIFLHLVLWSLLFEWIGPKFISGTTADIWDAAAYTAGALLAALWWNRYRWREKTLLA